MKKGKIKLSGQEITFLEAGAGRKAVFMLHGWGGSKESFEPLLKKLAMQRHFFAIDFPGFGDSPEPKKAWHMRDYAALFHEFVAAMVKEHEISEEIAVIVHSFGGRVIFKYLAREDAFPVEKLVLIAPAGIKHSASLKNLVVRVVARIGRLLLSIPFLGRIRNKVRNFFYRAIGSRDYEKLDGVMKETFGYVIKEDLKKNLRFVKSPTWIFWGKKDAYVPVADGKYIHKRVKDSKLTIFDDGKHGIHKTHAEQIASLVNKFLK